MPELGGRGLVGVELALDVAGQRPVHMRPADLQLGLQARQREAGVLEVEDRLLEGGALLGELHRLVEGALRAGLGGQRDRQTLLGQLVHQVGEALALFAQTVGDRDAHVLEEQLGGVGGVLADLVEVAPAGEAVAVGLDQDQRDALGALRRVGLGHDHDHVGVLAVGDVGLLAADDVVVAVLLGRRLDALEVGAGARLGHRDGADRLAGDEPGQPLLLLLFRAVGDQVVGHDVGLEREAGRGAEVGELFGDDGVVAVIEAHPAVFFGDGGTEHPGLAGGEPDRAVDDAALFEFVQARGEVAVEDLAHRIPEQPVLLVVNAAVHGVEHMILPMAFNRPWRY